MILTIPSALVDEIRAHSHEEKPMEACGYLAGLDGTVSARYPMVNVDQSGEHYSFDREQQFEALAWARGANLRLIGTYHSHPASSARMSREDIRLAIDPEMHYLIFSVPDEELRAYRVAGGATATEISIIVNNGGET